jgi:ribosome-associated toxin RatA of RatAB toxin-antitoxin module
MNRSNKIIIVFYIGLAISLISAYSYLDSLYERPQIDLQLPTEPIKKISFENIVNTRTHAQMYDVLTDIENYSKVLPKNILSVEILNTTDNSITAIEELNEKFITTKLTVKHSFIPMEKHTIEILDGDAQGTIITQSFEKLPDALKIKTVVDLNLKGILYPVGFLPKSSLQHAVNTVIGEFAIYAKTKYVLSENENIVDSLYRENLLRRADPDGLKFYVKMLEEEKMTINDVKESLMNSEEYKRLIILKEFNGIDSIKPETRKAINELYQEILKRPVDDEGLLYYSAMFKSEKLSLDDIRNELLISEERSQINLLNENK